MREPIAGARAEPRVRSDGRAARGVHRALRGGAQNGSEERGRVRGHRAAAHREGSPPRHPRVRA
eukprot:292597-Prorocentrum_minimum.AAC.1